MSEKRNTVDFGAHIFRVEIPAARTGEFWIIEDYGYRGGEAGIPRQEARAVLERRVWSQIADAAQRDFNPRLKAAGLNAGTSGPICSTACWGASCACWPGRPRKPPTTNCP